jgi:glycosyltransferase involved in cell wall biosynthesis
LSSQTLIVFKLNIFGKGPDKNKLQFLIQDLGLSETVSLKEPVQDIENQYLNSSIIAMTSRYEGLPMALLEGQSAGLPLISYACKCGPKDIIDEGFNGFLIDEGDKEKFAEKLLELIEDDQLRKEMGKNSYNHSKNFSEEVIMQKWIDLFNETLSKKI